jgi:hypothetical protein
MDSSLSSQPLPDYINNNSSKVSTNLHQMLPSTLKCATGTRNSLKHILVYICCQHHEPLALFLQKKAINLRPWKVMILRLQPNLLQMLFSPLFKAQPEVKHINPDIFEATIEVMVPFCCAKCCKKGGPQSKFPMTQPMD